MLDGREFRQLAVQRRGEQRIELGLAFDAAVQQCVVVSGVGLVKTREITRELVDVGCRVRRLRAASGGTPRG